MVQLLNGDPSQVTKQRQDLLSSLNQQNSPRAHLSQSVGALGKDVASAFAGRAPTSNVAGDRAARSAQLVQLLGQEEDRNVKAQDRQRRVDAENVAMAQSVMKKYDPAKQQDIHKKVGEMN